MLRSASVIIGLIFAIAVVAMLRQHYYYADVRRNAAQDHQATFYGGETFHVLTLLASAMDNPTSDDIIDEVRAFKRATQELGNATWIYAGKRVFNGQASVQLGEVNWTAGVFVQYPSRQAYLDAATSEAYENALANFSAHYSQGARRSAFTNALFPQYMLLNRISQGFGQLDGYPFEPADMSAAPEDFHNIISKLRAEGELGARGMVVLNLQKHGSPEQQAADAKYVAPMIALMARLGYGPMHMAAAEPVPGAKDFDQVAIVFYPGTNYFADMVGSKFYRGIFGDKQLGDNQSTVTVPILDLL